MEALPTKFTDRDRAAAHEAGRQAAILWHGLPAAPVDLESYNSTRLDWFEPLLAWKVGREANVNRVAGLPADQAAIRVEVLEGDTDDFGSRMMSAFALVMGREVECLMTGERESRWEEVVDAALWRLNGLAPSSDRDWHAAAGLFNYLLARVRLVLETEAGGSTWLIIEHYFRVIRERVFLSAEEMASLRETAVRAETTAAQVEAFLEGPEAGERPAAERYVEKGRERFRVLAERLATARK